MENKILILKKCSPKIKIKNLKCYQYCNQYTKMLSQYHFKFDPKDEIDLENTKVIIESILNKLKIDDIYKEICFNDFVDSVIDFNTLNHMIESTIMSRLSQFAHFYNPDLILIPIFDQKLNFDFVSDYLRTNLKWEKQLWQTELLEMKNPIDLYGYYFYPFSDFKLINHYDSIYYFYLEDTKKIYLFDNEKKVFIDAIPVSDSKKEISITINELIEIVEYHHLKDEKMFDYLLELGLISNKTYKKINKK